MDYSKLSDFEINRRVADIAMNGTWHVKPSHPDNDTGGWLYGSNGIQTYELPDYCNNPENAWPIIVEHKINIEWHEWKNSEWMPYALNNATMKSCYATNPLRAAMITFLMMQESLNAPANSTGSDIR